MGKRFNSSHTRSPDLSRNTHNKRMLPENNGLSDLDGDSEGTIEINNRSARRAKASQQRKFVKR